MGYTVCPQGAMSFPRPLLNGIAALPGRRYAICPRQRLSAFGAALQSCPALALQGKSPSLAVVSPYGAPMPHMSPLGHIVERCEGSCWCRVGGATSRPGSWGATSARHITTAHRFPYRLFVPVRPFPSPLARCAQYRRRIEGRKSDDWEIA